MNILIHCGGMPFNGDTVKTESLGGSETAAWAMARELVALGHKVRVFSNGEPGEADGVRYESIGRQDEDTPLGDIFEQYAKLAPHDVLVIQRNPTAFNRTWNSKLNVWWTHDLGLKRYKGMVSGMMWNVDQILTVSEWHKRQMCEVYGIPADFVTATTNGIYPEDFSEPSGMKPGSLLYSSRPERGLEHLVKPGGIMERLGDDFHLNVCSYNNTTPQSQQFYAYLYQRCEELPNVTLLGHLTKGELYEVMAQTWLHCYPTEFEETSCITAMETQAAGLPIITSAHGALPETLHGAGAELIPLKGGRADADTFVGRVRKLYAKPRQYEKLEALCDAERYHWKHAATQWSDLFEGLLAAKSENTAAVSQHMWRNEDITALKHFEPSPDVQAQLEARYHWSESQEKYTEFYAAMYKNHFEGDDPSKLVDMSGSSRAQTVVEALKAVESGGRVVDFGPAEGSLTMVMAKARPDLHFICVELNQMNLERLQEVVQMFPNVEAHQGDQYNLPDEARGADAIVAAEVIEHVIDPVDTCNRLRDHVGGNPYFVVTTPYGPWGLVGKAVLDDWRCHLHHFEIGDLRDMFGHLPDYNTQIAPSGFARAGEPVGSVTTSFVCDAPIQAIDYGRKLKQQAPRETLALCMIVKDGADTVGKAIKSAGGIADEIIVALDETTTDNTREICEALGATVFETKSAQEIGFDAARNLSIAAATSDWIMWLDADEELLHPAALLKYLRPSCINGLAIAQHHMSIEPLGCLETDHPCRVFRRLPEIKFYGVVHEHPEAKLNEGPGLVTMIADVKIAHPSYTTEEVRRDRFKRNLPLMVRDRLKNPDRLLGMALWLRDCGLLATDMAKGVTPPEITIEGEVLNVPRLIEEGKQAFAELLEAGAARMVLRSLPYYAAILDLAAEGFYYDGAIVGASLVGPPQGEPTRLQGRFRDEDELGLVVAMVNKEKVGPLMGDYV